MKSIDEVLLKLKQLDAVESRLKDSKAKLRQELDTMVSEMPDKTYDTPQVKVSYSSPRVSRRVSYDKLLGYLGEKRYAMYVTSTTGKPTLTVRWK